MSLADLNMLAVLPGRERTLLEFHGLLAHAGLRLDRVTSIASQLSVMEASAS